MEKVCTIFQNMTHLLLHRHLQSLLYTIIHKPHVILHDIGPRDSEPRSFLTVGSFLTNIMMTNTSISPTLNERKHFTLHFSISTFYILVHS